MIWKSFFIVFLAVGVSASVQISMTRDDLIRKRIGATCHFMGANDADARSASAAFIKFVNRTIILFDPATLGKKVNEVRSNYTRIKELFRTYCAKAPQLKSNIHRLTTAVRPCYKKDMRENTELANIGTDQIIDFLCNNEGEKISLFVNDGGLECFKTKERRLGHCKEVYATHFLKFLPERPEMMKNMTHIETLPLAENFATCVVKELRNCSDSSPADITESVLNIAHDSYYYTFSIIPENILYFLLQSILGRY